MAMRMPHDAEGKIAVATPGDAANTGTGFLPVEAIVEYVVLVGHRGVRLTPARTYVNCGHCDRTLARVTNEMGTSTLGAVLVHPRRATRLPRPRHRQLARGGEGGESPRGTAR